MPKESKKMLNEIIFEFFEFDALQRVSPASMVALNEEDPSGKVSLIVDCGFSFINITPVFDGFQINFGNIRVSIGGSY